VVEWIPRYLFGKAFLAHCYYSLRQSARGKDRNIYPCSTKYICPIFLRAEVKYIGLEAFGRCWETCELSMRTHKVVFEASFSEYFQQLGWLRGTARALKPWIGVRTYVITYRLLSLVISGIFQAQTSSRSQSFGTSSRPASEFLQDPWFRLRHSGCLNMWNWA